MEIKVRDGYESHKKELEFLEASYEGGEEYREGKYLVQRALESDEKYKSRLESASFVNYCAPIIDTYTSYLMGARITRDFGNIAVSPSFESFLDDADGFGRSYYQFLAIVARSAAIYGAMAVVVDKPRSNAITRAQEIEQGIRPYLTAYEPEDIINVEYERIGWQVKLSSVTIKEECEIPNTEQFKIWYADRWEIWQRKKGLKDAVKVDEGAHALGVVPVVFIVNRDNGSDFFGMSDIGAIAEINRKIYNIDADIEEVRAMTAFPFLEIPENKDPATGKQVVVGSGNALTFDPNYPNARAAYLEPTHTSIQVMLQERAEAVADIQKISRLGGDAQQGSRVVESGAALEMRFQQLNALLAEKASNMEDSEEAVLHMYCKWEGVEFDGNIEYPDKFGVSDVSLDINNFAKAISLIKSQTFAREKSLEIVAKLLNFPDAEVMDAVKVELSTASAQSLVTDQNGNPGA